MSGRDVKNVRCVGGGGAQLVLIVILMSSSFPQIGSLSLKPPAEEILNTHLCPDPMIPRNSKLPTIFDTSKIMSISLERTVRPKDRTNSYFSRFRPCTFIETPNTLMASLLGEDNLNSTVVRIRSINLNVEAWNFSNSAECTKIIMFRSWAEYGHGPVMCGRDNYDQYLGPYGNPMILYYHLNEQGIAFPLLHANYGQNDRDQRDVIELKYMLIYYTLKKNGVRTCRVQQYKLDPFHQGCPASTSTDTNCGEYNCSELEILYQKKMTVNRNGDYQQQRYIIVKTRAQDKYRVRNFLRQKFVPIVFLLVLIFAYKSYMKAGLRLNDPLPLQVPEMRLSRYHNRSGHRQHQSHMRSYMGDDSRDHFRDVYFEYGGEHIPGLHIPYEASSTGGVTPGDSQQEDAQHVSDNPAKYLGHETRDMPPSYDSLFPPTYTEATATTPKNPNV